MTKLKFHDARITLMEAVAVLATNQEPWAERVKCSYYDFVIAELHPQGGYPSAYIAIMKPFALSLAEFENYASMDYISVHKIEIRVDDHCPEGEVQLIEA